MGEPDRIEEEHAEGLRLVGSFMYSWALLESAVNHSVSRLLRMDSLEGAIATANMTFAAKISIIKTAVHLNSPAGDWQKEALKDVERVRQLSFSRNQVAHQPFTSIEGGGVQFYGVQAKGQLKFPTNVWRAKDFEEKASAMRGLHVRLSEIVATIIPAKRGIFGTLGRSALGPGLLGDLDHLVETTADD